MDKVVILFLSANPPGTTILRLDEEFRSITAKIRAADYRDSLSLISCPAARPDDFLQALHEHRPHIVHFSGHGTQFQQLMAVGDSGGAKPIEKDALVRLFETIKDNIRVVLLNACFSEVQAKAISAVIDCTIGMNKPIGDEAAAVFSASFYRALAFGRSVKVAFDEGVVALVLGTIRVSYGYRLNPPQWK